MVQRGVLMVCTAIGALVLVIAVSLAILPLVLAFGLFGVLLVLMLLIGWGGIEGMAALERWLEKDERFQR
jgi:hypothetical protein